MFDGIDPVVGAVSDYGQQYTIYRTNHFLPQRAVPTDVTIDVSGEPVGGQTYRVSAIVGLEEGGTPKTVRVYMVQVLDHWPPSQPYHRNTFKQAAPTTDIALQPGESHVVQHDFTFDADSWADPENIKIVAWAQAPVEVAPAQVYQAATRTWPLESYPDDVDGDGVLDWEDNCPRRYNPDQLDADTDEVGDVCDNCSTLENTLQANADEDPFGDACDNCPVLHHLDQDDTDGDGVGDACDSCPEVNAPGGVNPFGKSLGTLDLDCDVDLDDYAMFQDCFTGQGIPPPPGCEPADLDGEGDVDLLDFSVLTVNFSGPLVSPPNYVGATLCGECHQERHTSWLGTIHSTAFETLILGGAGDNALCFPCHAVGYGVASGFVDLATTPHLAGVQCENCHGPGSTHSMDPDVIIGVNLDSDLCGACHQSCHGLCGEDHHPQYEQWSESKHSTALGDMIWQPNAADECLQCHSTDYRLAPAGQKPTLYEAVYDLECVACHNPHGSENAGQLRLPPNLLCADCHTTGVVLPEEEPDQPQAEMLHGTGGFKLDGTPMEGPYTEHWWGIPDECAVCHVHKEPYGGPSQPVNSGHTFVANMRACEPCHSEVTATLLVATVGETFQFRLDAIAPYFDPADPLYIDPASLPPEERARYDVARFNYEFVVADRSMGSHNAEYACLLLSEVESFLGIPPWLCQPGDGPLGYLLMEVPSLERPIDQAEMRP